MLRIKRLASIGVILFTLLTHTVSAVPASGNGWVNEPPWREVYYGQSISGNPYIGETLVYNPGSWPVTPGVTHEWRLSCCTPLNDSGVLSTALTFTLSENLAGMTTLAMFTVDRSRKDVVYYSRTPVGRITCSPIAPPAIKVNHDPSQPFASLTISGGANPSIAKSVGRPRPAFVWPYLMDSEPTGEDDSSWPNKTYDYFVGKNGQVLTWSVYSKKIVKGWFYTVDCSSMSTIATVEFGVVLKEIPTLTGLTDIRLANDNPVWGNQSVQTYQWTSNGVPIPGETSPSYTGRPGGTPRLSLEVTGSKPGWPSRTISTDPQVGEIAPRTSLPSVPPTNVNQPTPVPSVPPTNVNQPSQAPSVTVPTPIVVEQSVAMKQLSASPQKASPALIKKLTSKEIQNLDPQVFAQIPASTISAMDSKQAKSVTPAQLLALSSSTLKKVSPKLLASLPAKTLAALPTSRLTQLTASQKKALTSSQLKSLTVAQRKAVGR